MVQAEAEYQEQLAAREERLFRTGAVSRQDVENARAMVATARAKVAAARSKVNQTNAMVASAEAKVDAARARAEQARAMETSALRKRDAMAAMAGMSRAQLRTAEVVRDYVTIVAPRAPYSADARPKLVDEQWAWAINRSVVWASVSFCGRTGPDSDLDGYDLRDVPLRERKSLLERRLIRVADDSAVA